MKITALIPIKHNSTRVPGKNFRLMNNKPLYQWIIDTLLQVKSIDSIVIDTDSDILFENVPIIYKKEYESGKIKLYERPIHLRPGDTSTNELFKNVINSMNLDADYYFQTHTTNPLLKVETIEDAIKTFLENNDKHHSLFSVKTHHTRFYDKDGNDMNHNRKVLIPTQDLDPIYEENSCMYLFSKKSIVENNARIADNAMMYPMNDIESQDIDWEDDFTLTEILMKKFYLD